MAEVFGFDCYSPQEIAQRVENVGVTKAKLPLLSQVALGVLAGGFIGLGGAFSTLVLSDGTLGHGRMTETNDRKTPTVMPLHPYEPCIHDI